MHYSEMFRSIYLPIAAIIYLSICLSIYLQLPLSIFLSVYLSTYRVTFLSIYLFINIIYLSIYLCVPEKCPISPIKYFCLHQNCNKLHTCNIYEAFVFTFNLTNQFQNSRILFFSLILSLSLSFFFFFNVFSLYIYSFLYLYLAL